MTLEAYIEANAASFPNRESRESLKKFAECIPALPLIAQHYLELRGDLFDPKIDMKGISQEQALEGSWAAILLPANRNLILHSIVQKNVRSYDEDYNRHVELLLPYLDERLISQCMNTKKPFEPEVSKSAQHIGRILLSASRLKNEIFPVERKAALYTTWVKGLQLEHFNTESTTVMSTIWDMLKKSSAFPQDEKKQFAQQALLAIERLSVHKDIQQYHRNDTFLQCIAMTLQQDALSSKLKDADGLFKKITDHINGVENADQMAIILSKWKMNRSLKTDHANSMIQKIFTEKDSYSREVMERKTASDALDVYKSLPGFIVKNATLKQIALWAVNAYSSEKKSDRDMISGNLASMLHATSYEQYTKVYAFLAEDPSATFRLDLLMTMANPSWLGDKKTTYPLWYEMLERSSGNRVLLGAIMDAKVVSVDECMQFIVEKGHEQWLVSAGIAYEKFEKHILKYEEARISERILQVRAEMKSSLGQDLPDSLDEILSFRHKNSNVMQRINPMIISLFSELLSRNDLPTQLRDKLDARYSYQIPLSEKQMKNALKRRGLSPMRDLRKRYITTLVERSATKELLEGYTQELFGNGIDGQISVLQGVFALPAEKRNGKEFVPKIREIIINWLSLSGISSATDEMLPNTLGRQGIAIMKQIQSSPFWSDDVLKNRAILEVIPKKLMQKLFAISQIN